jgi:hypothetical protein
LGTVVCSIGTFLDINVQTLIYYGSKKNRSFKRFGFITNIFVRSFCRKYFFPDFQKVFTRKSTIYYWMLSKKSLLRFFLPEVLTLRMESHYYWMTRPVIPSVWRTNSTKPISKTNSHVFFYALQMTMTELY